MRIKLHFKYFIVLIPLTAVLIFTYFNAQVQPCITRSIAFAPSCLELFHENSLVDTTNAFAVDRLMFLNGNFKPPNGTPVVSYQAPDRSYFSVVDMARVSKASVFAKAAIRYLEIGRASCRERVCNGV